MPVGVLPDGYRATDGGDNGLGAMRVPRIATRRTELAGIVLLATPARSLEDLLLDQLPYLWSLKESGRLCELDKRTIID